MVEVKVKHIEYTPLLQRTRDSKAKTILHVGGAGSSKSWSLAQLMIIKLVSEENKKIGICRKTFPALRMTAMDLVLKLLQSYGIYNLNNHNKTNNVYQHNSNQIQFFSLDDPEKIKSADFNYIWMEEASEFTLEDYMVMKLRLRHPTKEREPNQIFLSLNPTDAHGWIPTNLVHQEDVEVIKSTFLDNPFLSKEYVKTITDLINQDENAYRVYALGEWGLLQRRIYTNYKIISHLPDMKEAKWCYGLDFGLVNPSALLKVYLLDGQFYLDERLYRSNMTNADIIEFLTHEDRGDIYGDPTEKQMIEEIFRAGFNAYDGHKTVKEGLDLCQRQTLFITKDSINLIKEIDSYQWKEDKNGNVLPEPVKFNDHLVDCMRWAIWGITERFGFATAKPGGREPVSTHSSFRGG